MEDDYSVVYHFEVSSRGNPTPEFPDEDFSLTFDGTDSTIYVVVSQFEKVLRAAGYSFDHLRVVSSGRAPLPIID